MKPNELFGVLVCLTGLLIVIYGLYEIWSGLENGAENLLPSNQDEDGGQVSIISFFAFGIPSMFVGAVIFFATDLIVRAPYRAQK
jgi:hypothetical protein